MAVCSMWVKEKNALLISSKQSPEGHDQNQRCIFLYNMDKGEMDSEPFLVIKRNDIINLIQQRYSEEYATENFKKILDEERDYLHLGPSGVAIQPELRNMYILSSKSKLLLIYDYKAKMLLDVIKLDKSIIPQPEGICFDKKNNLYIASEAKKGKPHLIVVPLKR